MDKPTPTVCTQSTHVLMFPLPPQGDFNPMLKLAQLICLTNPNLNVTFLNTTYNHQRLTRYTDIQTRFARFPGFRFEVIPDGLAHDHPRAGGNWLLELLHGLEKNATPFLQKSFSGSGSGSGSESGSESTRVSCLIVDSLLTFVYDLANEAKVPVIEFKATSACHLWAHFCVPKLLEVGEIPITGDEDMDELVQNIPGMTTFLRRRDLPGFCRVTDVSYPELQFMVNKQRRKCHPTILNTFDDLEGPILSYLKAQYPTIYTIGPIQAHLKHKLMSQNISSSNPSSSSFWEVDRSCISWLDQKPDKSVVYVSFGSLTYLTKEQFMEFWAGLVQSNKSFLWVMRSNMIIGSDSDQPDLKELLEETMGRGYVVSWAPQEEVLAHRAVGGFFTHCGWNSTLEGIEAGVPMLCWSYFYDQLVNSRYVSEVWRIGLDMKDTCDRNIVEKMINDLMENKQDELHKNMSKMSQLVKESVGGGSSHANLYRLIEDIKTMSKNVVN